LQLEGKTMLDSIDIKNYRTLKDLRLTSLGRVNLITGKNNTGKSTLLEAIAIYASKADLNFLFQLLKERGENFRPGENNKNITEINVKALASLFSDRKVGFEQKDAITIGSVEKTLFGDEKSAENSISIRFVKYFDESFTPLENESTGPTRRRRTIIENEFDALMVDLKIGLEFRLGNLNYIISLDEERPFRLGFRGLGSNTGFQFIRPRNIDSEMNGKLWDKITLSELEKFVIEALKIIETNTERIAFIEEGPRERIPVIKVTTSNSVLPLKSMGDGINRILTIILALVNSANGFLLIDEFENGLHYSIQKKLWKIIFYLTQLLNVQVFVTTHSEDCISGFEDVLNSGEYTLAGKLIRLDNDNGTIKQVEFSAKELQIASQQNIETR